jgi:hypothetical protein
METKKRRGLLEAILNFFLEALIAMALGISPLEAAALLNSPDEAHRPPVEEAQHGR